MNLNLIAFIKVTMKLKWIFLNNQSYNLKINKALANKSVSLVNTSIIDFVQDLAWDELNTVDF